MLRLLCVSTAFVLAHTAFFWCWTTALLWSTALAVVVIVHVHNLCVGRVVGGSRVVLW